MKNNFLISIVAPMYNEEENISTFIDRTMVVLKENYPRFELILVDDGSTDQTFEICKSYANRYSDIRILAFSRNYGHEIALTAGIDHAQGDYVVQLDTDLQHPPEFIPQLVDKAKAGFDIVYAARMNRPNESWLKRLAAKSFYKIASKMTKFQVPEDAGNFRVITKKVVESIRQLKENNRHLMMLYAYVGYSTASVPFTVEERLRGKSKYSYRKLINLGLDSIISFTHRPLRFMSIASIFISVIMAFYAGFILLQHFFLDQNLAEGVASLIFVISSLFAILFLFLAMISEYIGRILIESKNRPLYYIREEYRGHKTSAGFI